MKKDLIKLHHARSQKDFPGLKLEEDEYIELAISRSRLGLVLIWGAVFIGMFVLTLTFTLMQTNLLTYSDLHLNKEAFSYLYMLIFVLAIAVIIAATIATYVYNGNQLYITNRRLFHYQAISLFSRSTNVIDLTSVEDVSFHRNGIIDYIFKLGTIRLSTVGDETTYTFKYANLPTNELDKITHLVHVAKQDKDED